MKLTRVTSVASVVCVFAFFTLLVLGWGELGRGDRFTACVFLGWMCADTIDRVSRAWF